jgi:hypothetical protein
MRTRGPEVPRSKCRGVKAGIREPGFETPPEQRITIWRTIWRIEHSTIRDGKPH